MDKVNPNQNIKIRKPIKPRNFNSIPFILPQANSQLTPCSETSSNNSNISNSSDLSYPSVSTLNYINNFTPNLSGTPWDGSDLGSYPKSKYHRTKLSHRIYLLELFEEGISFTCILKPCEFKFPSIFLDLYKTLDLNKPEFHYITLSSKKYIAYKFDQGDVFLSELSLKDDRRTYLYPQILRILTIAEIFGISNLSESSILIKYYNKQVFAYNIQWNIPPDPTGPMKTIYIRYFDSKNSVSLKLLVNSLFNHNNLDKDVIITYWSKVLLTLFQRYEPCLELIVNNVISKLEDYIE